jgi:hypothetical protein
MPWYKAIWNWFNGNKTLFGAFILLLAQHVPPDSLLFGFLPIKVVLEWMGGILGGVGILHKVVKANTDPGPNP